ncbi:arylamine N-acetyltransferase [Streptomyces sp. JJ38]|uniref:arylamine N-acetyltransferase family protein n=1 Tax=Streptomyces sp. JJ38 TaxID=2738128 RepID=UPI001C593F63|nr:arylamine N-acetyltransferase [Streptomyces sp. JJ38]MBW1595515.1 arylamine N-acetyltransferase [Streptomyces sp. JJ38]
MWQAEKLDLDAYLSRINLPGATPRPDAATLGKLHRAHAARIPFENLEIMLGRPVPLDLTALQDKLVTRRRGGYCFEQNSLFAAVLERVGFSFTAHAARVRMGDRDKLLPATHMLLTVEAEGERWVADVGFGGDGPHAPVRLREGVQTHQGDWTFSVAREDGGVWVLRTLRPEGWFDLYAFTEQPAYPPDQFVANYYVSTHPDSVFTQRPIVQRPGAHQRTTFVGDRLRLAGPNGSFEDRAVSPDELGPLLEREFGIDLTEEELGMLRQRYRTISG